MDLNAPLRQLLDVPATFRRDDQTYTQVMTSVAAALALSTEANAELLAETNYAAASVGWIDVWADLAGILRRPEESDSLFQNRVPAMLLAWRDSVIAIKTWLSLIEGINSVVAENAGGYGYTVYLSASLSLTRLQQIIDNLAYVRPAGVPFSVVISTGGTYLTTVNYFGTGPSVLGTFFPSDPIEASSSADLAVTGTAPSGVGGSVTGAYLAATISSLGIVIKDATDNQLSALPSLLLVDQTINPPGQAPYIVPPNPPVIPHSQSGDFILDVSNLGSPNALL